MTTPDDRDEHEDHEHVALPAEFWESVREMRTAPNPFLIGQTTADLEVARALFDNDLRDIANAPGPPPGWHTLAPSVIGRLDVLDRTVQIVDDGPPLIIGRDLTLAERWPQYPRDIPPPWSRQRRDALGIPVPTEPTAGWGSDTSLWWTVGALAALTIMAATAIAIAVWP